MKTSIIYCDQLKYIEQNIGWYLILILEYYNYSYLQNNVNIQQLRSKFHAKFNNLVSTTNIKQNQKPNQYKSYKICQRQQILIKHIYILIFQNRNIHIWQKPRTRHYKRTPQENV
ncbi:hypothetical protein TTHERM_000257252 (macronuclear) [Tetrahymena thermophila SB210]|uniref:Uncharacterized protein n=1 Tax=Tetrahymena thermophila (strain SB210) TaxID=312017 RepID=W7X2V6_TETTS|nr:hypothetical protein TTHERM_000257252 [Tetrahymena thermophila SB210]EWS73640.1 hypothetical protein TTHERM_000257252 [Tetrahymena thermophila SB210]|eukprot:XP_012653870.1 hypothetical protein TTHERM_000257252 [Tetrahymena thermophila SB210]